MISKFSVKKPYTVLVGVILILVLGVVSFTKMSADLLPDINLPYVIVMTTYVGASPETVETALTVPVESSMATVNNIKSIQSMSAENYSVVILEFEQTADMDSVSLDMREKLDQLESYWPDAVGNPIIMKINPNMLPQMIAAVGVDGMTNEEVSAFAEENVIPALEALEGVASVNATGLVEESVHVVIREDKVAKINERLGELIDEKFEEAYDQINDAKIEIGDGERELQKAEKELKDGETKLNNAKNELATSKSDLEKKKNDTINELTNAKLQVLSGKSDLEAAKIHINTNISTVLTLYENYEKITPLVTLWNALDSAESRTFLLAYDPSDPTPIVSIEKEMDNYQTLLADYAATVAADPTDPTLTAKAEAVGISSYKLDAYKAMLTEAKSDSNPNSMKDLFSLDERVVPAIKAIDFKDASAKAGYDALMSGYYSAVYGQYSKVIDTYNSLGNQITAIAGSTKKADVDNYVKIQNGVIVDIADQISALDSKIVELYEGESEALVQFANGMSKIDLAEYQIDTNKASLESGKEEIKSGKESLADAKEQLEDAEEELETQKADAKETADMTGVLTVDTVSALLSAQNFSMPAGYVEDEGDKYLVRIGDKPDDEKSLSELPLLKLPMTDDEIITLADVADVFITSNAGEVYTNVNGEPGIILSIQKQTGYSTGDVADTISDKFEDLQNQYKELHLVALMDQGIYIDLVMSSIFENVLIGGLLAIFILIFFLKDIRPTLIIAISIPVSLIAAVVAMYFSGVTLNIISLSGLALGVGMLVDNSIVVIENIYRMRNEGMDAKTASIEGAKEVAGAIFASTLTTVSVFLPIVFTEGITRQIFVDMGLTIAYSLIASLVIALTVVPAMASKTLRKIKAHKERKESVFLRAYRGFLNISLKLKPLVIIIAIGLLVLSVVYELKRGTAYFPDMESTQIQVTVEIADGAKLKTVSKETDELVSRIKEIDDVVDVGAMAASSTLAMLGGMSTDSSDTTSTSIYVITKEERELSSEEIAKAIEKCAEDIEGIKVSVETSTMDMSALYGSGISVNIKGRDLDVLYDLANQAAAILEETEGTANVTDATSDTDPEFRITVDKEKAIKYGLTVAQVYAQIYPHFQDATSSTTLVTGTEDLSVYVADGKDEEITLASLKEMPIEYTNDDGEKEEIALSEIATFKDAVGLSTINRKDQSRMVTVSADIAEGYNVGIVTQEAEKKMESLVIPEGYSLEFSGENETIMEALKQLVLMLILAVVFIYLIMVAQFQSLLSPFIIMFTIPLAFTGGFAALYFTNNEISIVSMIGFVMLSGIIVNNGIVLVDYINQRREAGMSKHDAIIDAGVTRLRPVLMTALTTILALLTMAFSNKMGADMSKPLAIVVIGGMIYGTLMTLIFVPCVYDIFMREKKHKDNAPKAIEEKNDSHKDLEEKNDSSMVIEDKKQDALSKINVSGEPVIVTLDENNNIIDADEAPNPMATIKIPKNANFEIIDKRKDSTYKSEEAIAATVEEKISENVENKFSDKDDLEFIEPEPISKPVKKHSEPKHQDKKPNPYMVGWNV